MLPLTSRPKVSAPHMGSYAIAFKSLIEELGCEMVIPPPITRKTIELGCRHSPEFVCLPFKINLGNYIEALEEGAEILLQAGRSGACRYGYYAEVQEQILQDLGYKFRMLSLFSGGKRLNFVSGLREVKGGISRWQIVKAARMTILKIMLIDEIERRVRKLRAYEVKRGNADKLLADGLCQIKHAKTPLEMKSLKKKLLKQFDELKINNNLNPVKIGIVGELYVVMEPRSNLDIERKLGKMGIEVIRPMCLSGLLKHAVFPFRSRRITQEGKNFIQYELGAHGGHSVGHTVEFAREGIDGVIHLYPFTCMPELSARAVLGNVSKTLNIPVLHFSFSEQTGEAGFDTRLEAFADMLERKKKKHMVAALPQPC